MWLRSYKSEKKSKPMECLRICFTKLFVSVVQENLRLNLQYYSSSEAMKLLKTLARKVVNWDLLVFRSCCLFERKLKFVFLRGLRSRRTRTRREFSSNNEIRFGQKVPDFPIPRQVFVRKCLRNFSTRSISNAQRFLERKKQLA